MRKTILILGFAATTALSFVQCKKVDDIELKEDYKNLCGTTTPESTPPAVFTCGTLPDGGNTDQNSVAVNHQAETQAK